LIIKGKQPVLMIVKLTNIDYLSYSAILVMTGKISETAQSPLFEKEGLGEIF